MKYKKITIFALIALIIINSAAAMDESEIQRIRNQIEPKINQAKPTFTNILTTVYHSVSSTDFPKWYTGAASNYDVTTSRGWCIILESLRGFYEDVKCQGSGVHNNRVYQYSTIQITPEDSVPIDQKYTRGRTATQTDPHPKWTVAVNNQPGTPCYIPYGTLMYIFFEQGNPWNGVYRAEDTGVAFRGMCKIDVYAGVGSFASNEAIRHVSGKKPQIFILDPEQELTNRLSNELAESYKILSPEDYVAKYGSSVITTEYIPQLDKSLAQVGEIIVPYSSSNTLLGILNFYETIKKFSNEILKDCSIMKYEEKDYCIHKKIKEYQEKIQITQCFETKTQNIFLEEIEIDQQINMSGKIINLNTEEYDLKFTLEQTRGPSINMSLTVPTIMKPLFQEDTYIKIQNAKITQKEEILTLITTENTTYAAIEQEKAIIENKREIALKAADCNQVEQDCLCQINLAKTDMIYELIDNRIIANNQEIKTNTHFYPQSTEVTDAIRPHFTPMMLNYQVPFDYRLQQNNDIIIENTQKLLFKKEQNMNGIIYVQQNYEPELEMCELKEKHTIFCAQPITEGKNYFQRTFYPKMNFALKI